jgi:hypothetical protein
VSGSRSPSSAPLFGAPTRDPLKNREMGGASALGGRCSMTVTNNQPIGGVSGRRYVWVEARRRESAWGDTVPSFGATTQAMKKIIYKIHRCLWTATDRQRLIQQPTENRLPRRRGVWRGCAPVGRHGGKCNTIVLGALEVGR